MTKVKICGLKTLSAVQQAVACQADYIGFVFAKSSRQISIDQAHDLAKVIPKTIKTVGVFKDVTLSCLLEHIEKVPLDMVQIHGSFEEDALSSLSVPVIRAFSVTDIQQTKADYLLIDAPVSGSGQVFDWKSIDPNHIKHPFFIAGGLDSSNVGSAITYFNPDVVDVSSGVETDGQKDNHKIKAFIEGVKNDLSAT